MKRLCFIFSLIIFCVFNVWGQDFNAVFVKMPGSVIYGLTADDKNKLISNPQDTAVVITNNDLYEDIRRLAISADYIAIKTSDVGTVQIKLLPLVNNSEIICVVKTVCKNICDSRIDFYTSDWEPIENNALFPVPQIEWFIRPDADRNSDKFKNAVSALDINPVKLELSPKGYVIKAALDIEGYLGKESYKELKPFLINESRSFTWDKISFK